MRFLHVHWDRNWQSTGIYGLYECRCGARRTVRLSSNTHGPEPSGWPLLNDRHGRDIADSGWHAPGSGRFAAGLPDGWEPPSASLWPPVTDAEQ